MSILTQKQEKLINQYIRLLCKEMHISPSSKIVHELRTLIFTSDEAPQSIEDLYRTYGEPKEVASTLLTSYDYTALTLNAHLRTINLRHLCFWICIVFISLLLVIALYVYMTAMPKFIKWF